MDLFFYMHKIFTYSILFIATLTPAIAQNLVRNPSFEDHIGCPQLSEFNNYVKDWKGLGTICYFHTCAPYVNGIPVNIWGCQETHSGNAYAAILVYYYDYSSDGRGYVEGTLTEPLKKDTLYCVSYYVNRIDTADGAIQNIDAYLSDTLVDYPPGSFAGTFPLELPAQIRSPQIVDDSVNWTRISGLYKAHGGEKYITIGNFQKNINTNKIQYNPYGVNLPYYIDDVCVAKAGIGLAVPGLGADTVVCRSTLPLRLSAPPGYDAYLWSNGDTTRETYAAAEGKYWIKCIMNGCGELYDEKVISFDTPLLNLGNDTVICKGENLTILAQSGFNAYLWNTGDTSQSITVSESGVYTLQTLDHCGLHIDTVIVAMDSVPAGIINLGNDTTLCRNGVDVPIVISSNIALPNYRWNTGDTTAQITVDKRGVFTLQCDFRCGTVSDSIFVNECPPVIYLPNAFTPDGDGLNDVFRAITINTQVELMIIYNRWGQKIFESKGPFPEWDGTFNNDDQPGGLYAYVVYYSNSETGDKRKQKRGTVLLLR